MISVRRIAKAYKNVQALQGVDLDFTPGLVTGVLGPNGCGKSTLIKAILGLVIPDQGEILMNGSNVNQLIDFKKHLGYMPQNSQFPGNLTSAEIFRMIEDIRGVTARRKEELIELFEIGPHLNKPAGELSGGTRQKASAVLALMFDPDILILDEPTVGLDPVAVVRLKALIKDFALKGKTVILVTHMLGEIEQLVQKMYFILEGRVKFSGSLDEIKARGGSDNLDEAVVKHMSGGYAGVSPS